MASSRDQRIPTTFGEIKIFRDGDFKSDQVPSKSVVRPRRSRRLQVEHEEPEFQMETEPVQTEAIREPAADESADVDFFGLEKTTKKLDSNASEPTLTEAKETSAKVSSNLDRDDFGEFGSISNLRHPRSEPKTKAEIPFIASKKLIYDEEDVRPKVSLKSADGSAKSVNKKPSNHKALSEEVPQWFDKTQDEATDFLFKRICYFNEEEGLFAIDKPYGLPSTGGPGVTMSVASLLPLLEKRLKLNSRLLMAHRLDEFTTGVMLFALCRILKRNAEVMNKVRSYFNERKVVKQYLAITKYIPTQKDGEIDIPLIRRDVNGITKTYLSPNYDKESKLVLEKPGKESSQRTSAVTRFRVLDSNHDAAFLEVQPLTGFQHQIRAHLAFGLGCPILGDHKYSHYSKMAPQKLPIPMLKCLKISQTKVRHVPMHLHSAKLILPEFHKNSNVFISAKLPLHFLNNLKRLKLRF